MVIAMTHVKSSRAQVWPVPAVIAWLIWRRHRIGLCIVGAVLLVSTVLAHTAFSGVLAPLTGLWESPDNSTPESGPVNYKLMVLAFAFVSTSLPLSGLYLAFVPGMTVDGTTYPPHLLRAPAKSLALAGWPLLFGAVTVCCFWAYASEEIVRPMGLSAPLLQPILLLMLTSVVISAVCWSPLTMGFRLLFTLVIGSMSGVVAFAVHPITSGSIELAVATAWIALIACAVAGLGRSRCGEIYQGSWPKGLEEVKTHFETPLRRFGSAFEAQRRLEWLGMGVALPIMVVFFAVVVLPLALFHASAAFAISFDHSNDSGTAQISLWASVMMVMVAIVPMCSGFGSMIQVNNAYILTRPLSLTLLVAARLRAAFAGATIEVGVSLLLLAFWLASPAFDGHAHVPLAALLWPHGGVKAVGPEIFCVLVFVAVLYRLALDGCSIGLSGSPWIALWNMSLTWVSVAALAICALPSGVFSSALGGGAVPGWVCAFAGVRVALGLAVLWITLRRGLIAGAVIVRAAALWIAAAAILYGISSVLMPQDVISPPVLALVIFLAMPLVRLSLGPLLLDRNRHR